MKTFFRSLWFLLFSLSAASAAVPGWSLKPGNSHAQVHVYNDGPAAGKVRLLLDVKPDEGWKTYWRTPGDGGFRPVIEWESQAETQWYWPRPVRFDSAGFSSVGYDRQVVFPLEVLAGNVQQLRGKLTLSLCSNLCVVNTFPLDIDLSSGPSAHFADAWDTAMSDVPPQRGNTVIVFSGCFIFDFPCLAGIRKTRQGALPGINGVVELLMQYRLERQASRVLVQSWQRGYCLSP